MTWWFRSGAKLYMQPYKYGPFMRSDLSSNFYYDWTFIYLESANLLASFWRGWQTYLNTGKVKWVPNLVNHMIAGWYLPNVIWNLNSGQLWISGTCHGLLMIFCLIFWESWKMMTSGDMFVIGEEERFDPYVYCYW